MIRKLNGAAANLQYLTKTLKHLGKFPSLFLLSPSPLSLLQCCCRHRNFAIISTLLREKEVYGGFKVFLARSVGSTTNEPDRSLFIAWKGGGGVKDFWGDHLIFRRTKGGISRN